MFNLLESDLEKKHPLLIKEMAEAVRDAKTKIFFSCRIDRRRVAEENVSLGQLEKKVAANRPEVPLPFPLYIEALFSVSYEHHNSRVDVRILSSTTKVRPSDL
jgi:hypothetical protein